jgi:hypothetical protein
MSNRKGDGAESEKRLCTAQPKNNKTQKIYND